MRYTISIVGDNIKGANKREILVQGSHCIKV